MLPIAQPPPDADDHSPILMRWLVGLRWVVFGFLAATLPFADTLFGFHVRYEIALPIVALLLVGNALAHRRLARGAPVGERAVALGTAIDLLAIGGVLAASGGAANPFSAVFFVHVALAATLLPARTTFALAGLAACVFAALFTLPSGACCPEHPANGAFSKHLYGMWAAFVVAAGLVAYFLTRVRGALDERGREIARLRRQADEAARFAGLGTLAAGTAHELATPLGTIAVLAGEIGASGSEADEQANGRSILAQVARCRDIIAKLQTARLPAEAPKGSGRVAIGAAVARAIGAWKAAHPDAVVSLVERECDEATVDLSEDDVEATICTLLDNALHATRAIGSAAPIEVELSREDRAVVIGVLDGGAGIAPHLEGRAGEPFLTTKEPGEGMGLGLYLVRTLLARVGGRLEVARREPQGTRVTLHLMEGVA